MRWLIVCFALGVWGCQRQAELLPWSFVASAALLCMLVSIWRSKPTQLRVLRCLAALLFGLAFASWRAELRLADRLPEALEGVDLEVSVRIADLPQAFERGMRFEGETLAAPAGVPARMSLALYASGFGKDELKEMPEIHAGEHWRFTVRLKQAHGSLNPYGFDYEGWMFERGIGATGYIRPKGKMERIEAFDGALMSRVNRWRESIRTRFERSLPDAPWRGVLVALVIGDQAAIPNGYS